MRGTEHASLFRAELGATFRLAWPLALANLLQMAIYVIDVIFVARLGQDALAAASLAVAIFSLLMFGFSAVTAAVAPLIAAEIGRRSYAVREVRRSVRMALWLAVIFGVIGVIGCHFAENLMLATGQKPELAARSGRFIALLSLGMIPMLISNVLRAFVSVMGRPIFATFVTALAILVNGLGNWMFVFGNLGAPALGLQGAALSSVITSVAMALAYGVVVLRDRRLRRYHIFGRIWRPEWARLREILRIGVPIGLTMVAEAGLFSSAAFLMGRIGEAQLAAHAIALQIAAAFFQVPFGIGQAATIRVGYYFGAGDSAGVGRAGWAAIVSCLAFQVASAAIMLLAPRALLSAYVDVRDPANLAMVGFAVSFLAIGAAFQLADGVQAVAAGALRGIQDTSTPLMIALFSYWAPGFGTAIALGLFTPLAGVGVWIGLASGLMFAAVLLLWRWRRRGELGLDRSAPALRARASS